MSRVRGFFKNPKLQLFLLILIVLIGLLSRINGINKNFGLWYDEAYCFFEASHSFPFGILNVMYNEDIHAPLYIFILHFWIKLFGQHDIILRLLSVLFGLLSIPVFYFVGKELSSKKTGLMIAAISSTSALSIFYSHEIKFYSLLILLGALSVLFLLRVKSNPCLKNYLGLVLTSVAILYTYTIGFVYVFLTGLIYLVYLYHNKKPVKDFLYSQLAILLMFLPYLPVLIHHGLISSKVYINPMGWARFGFSNIPIVFQDWFAPVLIGIMNVPQNFYQKMVLNGINPVFVFLVLLPSVVGLTGIVRALFRKDFSTYLLLIAVCFIGVEAIGALLGKFALITRYAILAFPIIIAVAGYGLSCFKNRFVSYGLILFILVVNVYTMFTEFGAARIVRPEGLNIPAYILNKYSFNEKDVIFMPYGGKFINKYYPLEKGKILPFDLGILTSHKQKLEENVFDRKIVYSINRNNAYDLLKPYFSSGETLKPFENYLKNQAVNKIPKKRYFVVVVNDIISIYDDFSLVNIASGEDYNYKKQPLIYLLSSKISADAVKTGIKYLTQVNSQKLYGWSVYVFRKD